MKTPAWLLLSSILIFSVIGSTTSKPLISAAHGFYNNPFTVTITATGSNQQLTYTLDGSNPRTSSTSFSGISPLSVLIDPASTAGRDALGGVVLRAAEAGSIDVATQTYIFTARVKNQCRGNVRPGSRWPLPVSQGSSQFIDYEMDGDVVNNPLYTDSIDAALRAVPTVSFVMELDSLFDPTRGIYMNSLSDGIAWERPMSMELLPSVQDSGFQIDGGVRIRGGYSRYNFVPKHSFRVYFRAIYGATKLRFPVFGRNAVSDFDKIDLSTAQNYSWSKDGSPDNAANTFVRDPFSRDVQGRMGQPSVLNRYCHLYINGCYWGLYQLQDRPDASYAESHFEAPKESYDAIKVNSGANAPYEDEATDGDLVAWNALWQTSVNGFTSLSAYFAAQGCNVSGNRQPDLATTVDVDNLIDYMLCTFYSGDFDGPISRFLIDAKPNNFYALRHRDGKEGFRFFRWDAEHSMFDRLENRTGPYTCGDQAKYFNPQWLHQQLAMNGEYRLRFADHVARHFFNDGCLTVDSARAGFLRRAAELPQAIIAESARWGDTWTHPAMTRVNWQRAIDAVVNYYMASRTTTVLTQLKNKKLFPTTCNAPKISAGTIPIIASRQMVAAGFAATVAPGTINAATWYTLDGSDPRVVGGAVFTGARSAAAATIAVIRGTRTVKARCKCDTVWSALREVLLVVPEDLSGLIISEINYHPADAGIISGDEYEFIEIVNAGTTPVNLTGITITGGISYSFRADTSLAPHATLVLVSNTPRFYQRYGRVPDGQYGGYCSNSGECIVLRGPLGTVIDSVCYSRLSPWPAAADGAGYSIVRKNYNAVNSPSTNPLSWIASHAMGGSPGTLDSNTGARRLTVSSTHLRAISQRGTILTFRYSSSVNSQIVIYDMLGRVIFKQPLELNSTIQMVNCAHIGLAQGVYRAVLQTGSESVSSAVTIIQ